MTPPTTERALLYLRTVGLDGVACGEVGGAVWPDRDLRGGRGVSHNGGGDYAAQMLLGRLKKAGLVEHASSEGSSRWRLSAKGHRTAQQLQDKMQAASTAPTHRPSITAKAPLEHKISLDLCSGARLAVHYFSDHEARWIFAYDYAGTPDIVNETRLVANYTAGLLDQELVLTMHVIVPARLGQEFYVGVDISPGAKTYLTFRYGCSVLVPDTYTLVEICKGVHDRVRLDETEPGLVRPIEFPFPVPDRLYFEHDKLHVPFLTNAGSINYFDLPRSTLR